MPDTNLATGLASILVDPAAMEWSPTKFPGIAIKVLLQVQATGLLTALFRWDPGSVLPDHEHVQIEQSYVLEGSIEDEEGEVMAGQYVARPAGSRHVARSRNGALILAVFLEPNRFFGEDGSAERFDTTPAT
ncbi:cupin domain-containing protein [Muricoccus aerilatus]|uniref:cupin domain-containing protein n=1 Tax=Muricoccus aerilatus TaxID=452982 RepID=UPI0005C19301|nr:cupin domain-containing protein [Roseomonas aerilata]